MNKFFFLQRFRLFHFSRYAKNLFPCKSPRPLCCCGRHQYHDECQRKFCFLAVRRRSSRMSATVVFCSIFLLIDHAFFCVLTCVTCFLRDLHDVGTDFRSSCLFLCCLAFFLQRTNSILEVHPRSHPTPTTLTTST